MKVVKQISTGKIAYRSEPEFEAGMGIRNAVAINGGKSEDYQEIEITDNEYAAITAPSYIQLRASTYKPISDQLDDFWHAMDMGILPKVEPFYSDINSVKRKYPKQI